MSSVAPTKNGTPVAGRQAEPIDPVFRQIRDLLYGVSGVYQPEDKLPLLVDSCCRRMREIKVLRSGEYWNHLTAHPCRDSEMRQLLNEITTGDAYFFRNKAQVDALRKTIFPELTAAKSEPSSKGLRIWSAGCSTGEDVYSIAISALEESDGLLQGWQVEIIATDVNDRKLEFANDAVYEPSCLHEMPELAWRKYFGPAGEGKVQVSPVVKQLVRFSHLDMTDESAFSLMKDVDIIFCRNVLAGLDGSSKSSVIDNLFDSLKDGGFLFLGACESLLRLNNHFRLVHFPGTVAYWKPPFGSVLR
jgi:chemotaxis protein methyltransferase CheR